MSHNVQDRPMEFPGQEAGKDMGEHLGSRAGNLGNVVGGLHVGSRKWPGGGNLSSLSEALGSVHTVM